MVTDPNLPERSEDEALAAEYALGLLGAEERRAFERRLREDPALRAMVDSWDQTFIPLAAAFEPVTPPTGTLTLIEDRLFADKRNEAKPSLLSSLWFWRGFSAIAAAAALFLAVAVYVPGLNQQPEGQSLIAQLQNEERALSVSAYFEPGDNTLVLTRASGVPESGRDFELWLIAPESAPVSLGTLPVGERIEVALAPDLIEQLDLGAALAISDEPNGGSTTGQPTGDILAVGPVSALNI
jgi:anti-sigma-K factor RskA